MALIVEDGSGKADAESYLSVADADTRIAALPSPPASWTGATTAAKEAALRDGTRYLDLLYGSRWRGRKTDRDNALGWPRFRARDDDEYLYDSDDIPSALEDATAQAAVRSIAGTDLLADLANPGTLESKSVQVGSIKSSRTYSGGNSPRTEYTEICLAVAPLIEPFGTVARSW